MATLVSRLSNTGNLIVNVDLDEITLVSAGVATRITSNTLFAKEFDEVTISSNATVKQRIVNTGNLQIAGIFDETTTLFSSNSWTTPGTYTWIVPQDVTSISAVLVGGGGGSAWSGTAFNANGAGGGGGGGGGLRYINNLDVTPGETLTLIVGAAGIGGNTTVNGTSGGNSSISRDVTTLVFAGGGIGGSFAGAIGNSNGVGGAGGTGSAISGNIGGGNGGTGGSQATNTGGGGGGGAGGYLGDGGNGGVGNSTNGGRPAPNSGAASGGSGSNAGGTSVNNGGGGVGLLGLGLTASALIGADVPGTPGSYGGSPVLGVGGDYGGGGGATEDDSTSNGRNGGKGGIRIIWSSRPGLRVFPAANTLD